MLAAVRSPLTTIAGAEPPTAAASEIRGNARDKRLQTLQQQDRESRQPNGSRVAAVRPENRQSQAASQDASTTLDAASSERNAASSRSDARVSTSSAASKPQASNVAPNSQVSSATGTKEAPSNTTGQTSASARESSNQPIATIAEDAQASSSANPQSDTASAVNLTASAAAARPSAAQGASVARTSSSPARPVGPVDAARNTNATRAATRTARPPATGASQKAAFERIAQLARFTTRGNETTVRADLEPEALGSVRVRMRLVNDALRVRMAVDSENARATLISRSDELASMLERQGVKVQSIDVWVAPINAVAQSVNQMDSNARNDGSRQSQTRDSKSSHAHRSTRGTRRSLTAIKGT